MTEKKEDSFAVEGAEALFEEALAAVEKAKGDKGKDAEKSEPSQDEVAAEQAKTDAETDDPPEAIDTKSDEAEEQESKDKAADDDEDAPVDVPVDSSAVLALRHELKEMTEARDKEAEERKKFYEQLLRITAEFDNFRKRTQREKEELRKYGHKSAMSDLLDVIDNFDRALETLSGADQTIREGIAMVHKQLMDILARHGVKRFKSLHEPFDYTRHEALQMVETDEIPAQHVQAVYQAGYELHDQLLRPARVVVSKAPPAPKEEAPEAKDDASDEPPASEDKAGDAEEASTKEADAPAEQAKAADGDGETAESKA